MKIIVDELTNELEHLIAVFKTNDEQFVKADVQNHMIILVEKTWPG